MNGTTSPEIFKKWTGIALVAGALERRVWVSTGRGKTFPNLYVLLMAAPGVGKHVVADARQLWRDAKVNGVKAFHVGPDNMTKASLLDRLAKAKRAFIPPSGPIETYHSMLIAAEEFGVLLPSYDTEYLGALNTIWNVEPLYEESRRTGTVKELSIERPLLNILAGYQPALMATTFPEEAWSSGLARRIIMVHSTLPVYRDLFDYGQDDSPEQREGLLKQLAQLSGLWGQCAWKPEAAQQMGAWDREAGKPGHGGLPMPEHSKLSHYTSTRTHTCIKLAIISAVSRSGHLLIEALDVRRAISWLLEAEATMPDIFREMLGKSDTQVIEEMYLFVQALWSRAKAKPVGGEKIRTFLLHRVPHEKVETLLQAAERAQILIRQVGTDLWIPRPRSEGMGVE